MSRAHLLGFELFLVEALRQDLLALFRFHTALKVKFQVWTIAKNCGHGVEFLGACFRYFPSGVIHVHVVDFAHALGHKRPKESERRRHRLHQDILDRIDDHLAETELGVIQIAVYRNSQIDFPLAILQEREREFYGKGCRIRAVNFFPQGQPIEHDVVLRIEFLFGNEVFQFEMKITLFKGIADIFLCVRVPSGQVDVLEVHRKIHIQIVREWVDLSRDLEGGAPVELPAKVYVGEHVLPGG